MRFVMLILVLFPALSFGQETLRETAKRITLDLDSLLTEEGTLKFPRHRFSTEGIVVSGASDPESVRRYLADNMKYIRLQNPRKKVFILVPPVPRIGEKTRESFPELLLDDLEVRIFPGKVLKEEYEKTAQFLRSRMGRENPEKVSEYAKDWRVEMERYLGLETQDLSIFECWYRIIWAASFLDCGEDLRLVFQ